MTPLSTWKPPEKRKAEDNMLLKYWEQTGGVIFTEVIVGRGGIMDWPINAKPRRIDGVQILSSARHKLANDIVPFSKKSNLNMFLNYIHDGGAIINVIEVKRFLNRIVLGQVIIGADLIELEYNLTNVGQVVVCEIGDPVLERICQKRNIKIIYSKDK